MITRCKAQDIFTLPRGTQFLVSVSKTLTHRERHAIFHYTAHRPVTLFMRDGTVIKGTLAESPGFFANQRLWLRVPGRKTRKGVDLADIKRFTGYRAPSLADALCAFVVLSAGNPAVEDVFEARKVVSLM